MRIEGVIATTASAAQAAPTRSPELQPRETSERGALTPQAQSRQQAEVVGEKMLSQAVEQAQKVVTAFNEGVRIKLHKDLKNQYVVQVVNRESGEVIREVPSERFLDMMAGFQKQIAGLFVDTEQ